MLEIKKLKKNFGNKKVLKGINLNVEKGEIVGIIGPSGCGKSTFLRSINLLEKPTSGEVVFEGKDLTKIDDLTEYRRKIGMVFQNFNLFDYMNVLDNIIFAPVHLKLMDKKEAIKKAKELLKDIGLLDKANYYHSELSGGQKQRIAIVRTLIMNPELILFDEPTSALDPEMIGEVTSLMRTIADQGMTMIVVSHEMDFIKSFCSRVIFMDAGEVVKDGTSKDIFDHPKDERLRKFLSKVWNR